jgi:DNA/RNA-binding domain of Phe-tRNA-synthetase-like protein
MPKVPAPRFTLDPSLASIVRPGVLWWRGAEVVERDERLDGRFADVEARLRSHEPADTAAVRAMYRQVGIDPTKTRPSSEALLRRVRKGLPLPRVNALVDVINWSSVELQLPYGLYDSAHISGDVTLRLGQPGEAYDGIRKDVVHVGGRLTLADAEGPFGNPTSDSARTMVTAATRDALIVVFAPRPTDAASVAAALDLTASRIAEMCGGAESARLVG